MIYRSSQFFRGFFAKVTPTEAQQVQELLSSAEYALFCRMPLDARRHSLNVCQMLMNAGRRNKDLLVAALLHDVGKVAAAEAGVRLGLWMRIPLVLTEGLSPQLIRRLSASDPSSGWRYTLHVHLEHPRIGAQWAEEAGASQTACWLIAAHQDKAPVLDAALDLPSDASEQLAALQWADSRN